jgi:hypothetical protein
MRTPQDPPRSFRANEEDSAILAFLQERLGLNFAGVIKLAIRRLYELEKGPRKK